MQLYLLQKEIQMITKEVFWNQIGNFNNTFLSIHIAWIVVSLILITLAFIKKSNLANTLLKAFLSITFLFNGIIFLGLFTTHPITKYFFAVIFVIVGLLFLTDIFRNTIFFGFPKIPFITIITIFWLVLVYTYPFFGVLLGRNFPYICMPMNPCPSTLIAITLVVAAIPKTSKILLISLLPWSLLALPKALGAYDCYEDAILFLSGIYGLIMLILFWRKIRIKENNA